MAALDKHLLNDDKDEEEFKVNMSELDLNRSQSLKNGDHR